MNTQTEAVALREEAQWCRQGALEVRSPHAQRILLRMAAECDAGAAALEEQERQAAIATAQGDAAPHDD